MANSNRKVIFFPAAMDGCAFYRMFLPHLFLPGSGYYQTSPYEPIPLQVCKGYGLAVVQRQTTEGNRRAMQMLKESGMKVVYDLDDDLWNLPYWNPAQKIFQQKEQKAGLRACMEMSDAITVSTPYLKSVLVERGVRNPPITVIENGITDKLFSRARRQSNSEIVIGWAGSNTHEADITEAFMAALQVAGNVEKVRFCIMSGSVPSLLKSCEKAGKVEFRGWIRVMEYPSWFSSLDWDIALAPLEDCKFNRSKSNIKFLEAAMLGIPCLASDVENYRLFCQGDADLEWLLCKKQKDWMEKLGRLVRDAELRQRMADKVVERARERYLAENKVQEWGSLFASLC